MKEQGEQQIRLPLSWSFIEGARSDIAFALSSFADDVREAAVMVVSELAENAVKYGEPVSGEDCAYISYSIRRYESRATPGSSGSCPCSIRQSGPIVCFLPSTAR